MSNKNGGKKIWISTKISSTAVKLTSLLLKRKIKRRLAPKSPVNRHLISLLSRRNNWDIDALLISSHL